MSQYRTITTNRRARRDYDILDTVEAGIVLTGTEIKSLRANRANIGDAYARPEGGELWLHNLHISPYDAGNSANHEPMRTRKLLLHKDQIRRLSRDVSEKGVHARAAAHLPEAAPGQGGAGAGEGTPAARQAPRHNRPLPGAGGARGDRQPPLARCSGLRAVVHRPRCN